jgi:hypothetical protein
MKKEVSFRDSGSGLSAFYGQWFSEARAVQIGVPVWELVG